MLRTGTSTTFITEVLFCIAGEPLHTPHAKLRYSTAWVCYALVRRVTEMSGWICILLAYLSSLIFCLWGTSEMQTLPKEHIHMWMCSSANAPMTYLHYCNPHQQMGFVVSPCVKHTWVFRLTRGSAALLQDWCLHYSGQSRTKRTGHSYSWWILELADLLKKKDIFFSVVRGNIQGKYNFTFHILENMSTLLHEILQFNVQRWMF